MIQFNLLPDVKLEFLRVQRTKRLLTLISVVASAAAIAILLLAVVAVDVVQKKSLHDLNNDVAKYSTQLKNVKDLDKILTVQNQLSTLSNLHAQKPVTSRLFGFLAELTPAAANLNSVTIDFTSNSLTISGDAPSLDPVSTYTDTLKGTKYSTDGTNNGTSSAFSNVVLSSFGRDDKGATFTITLTFDPAIFNSTNNIQLIVPATAGADQSSVFKAGS